MPVEAADPGPGREQQFNTAIASRGWPATNELAPPDNDGDDEAPHIHSNDDGDDNGNDDEEAPTTTATTTTDVETNREAFERFSAMYTAFF